MTLKTVSVIIPCFNDASYLNEALRELVAQEHRPLQVIVVDDGSSDIAVYEATRLHRGLDIVYIRQENAGPASARNAGLKIASGDYIQFLDSDDYMDPAKIRLQVEALSAAQGAAIAYCDYLIFEDGSVETRRLGPPHVALDGINFITAFKLWTIVHRFLYPIDVLLAVGGFDESLSHGEDLDLWLRLIDARVPFIYQSLPLAYYRFRYGRSASNRKGEALSRQAILRKFEQRPNDYWKPFIEQIVDERRRQSGT